MLIEQRNERDLSRLTLIVYVLQAIALGLGVTALIGVIINYVKRQDVKGTLYESHFEWQIRTFWFGLGGVLLGWLLTIILIGYVVLGVMYIWWIYRVVKGLLHWHDGRVVYS